MVMSKFRCELSLKVRKMVSALRLIILIFIFSVATLSIEMILLDSNLGGRVAVKMLSLIFIASLR